MPYMGNSVQAAVRNYYNNGGFINGLQPRIGRVWYVNGNTETDRTERKGPIGSDSNSGLSPLSPFATMSKAFDMVDCFDVIVLGGVIREQLTAPLGVFDVTIVGNVNRPRQATSDGVPTGGGASWLAPTSPAATTPLLTLREQGWTVANIQMAPVASSACIRLHTAESATYPSAGHFTADGLFLTGDGIAGAIGIEDKGGSGFCVIRNSRIRTMAGAAIKSLDTAIAVPLGWEISDNQFMGNTNDIAMSLSYGLIQRNRFFTAGSGTTNKVISTTYISTQGGNNQVLLNQFNNTEAQIAPGSGYTGAASDLWMNYVNDQAALAFGQPA